MFSALPFLYMFYIVVGFGSVLSLTSLHWLTMWAGLEMNLIGFLPIMAYSSGITNTESAVKYFIIQALGSSFLIFGSVYLYSLSYSWEVLLLDSNSFAFIFVISGLLIKLGVFPFHYWLPSVMAGLPWLPCLLLATWQKLAPLFLVAHLVDSNLLNLVIMVICFIAGGSSILGGLGGMNQTQVRALVAYSSIGHMGWLIYGCMQSSWILKVYYTVYVFITFSLFISFLGGNINFMKDLNSMVDYSYLQVISMVILLSLGGLPPFLGFIPKMMIISLSASGPGMIYVVLLIMGSLMSLFYYLHLLYIVTLSVVMKSKLLFSVNNMSSFFLLMLVTLNLIGGFGGTMVDSMMMF